MVPLLPLETPEVVPEEKGSPVSSWSELDWSCGGSWDAHFTIGFGRRCFPHPHLPAWLLQEMVGASLLGGSNAFLGRLQKYPIRERSLLRSRSCPQPGPLQGLGQRDECLCVSVAMCVLSSLCSVGGLLCLCIVTPLTVVETATPINSSQELCLQLRTFGFYRQWQ